MSGAVTVCRRAQRTGPPGRRQAERLVLLGGEGGAGKTALVGLFTETVHGTAGGPVGGCAPCRHRCRRDRCSTPLPCFAETSSDCSEPRLLTVATTPEVAAAVGMTVESRLMHVVTGPNAVADPSENGL